MPSTSKVTAAGYETAPAVLRDPTAVREIADRSGGPERLPLDLNDRRRRAVGLSVLILCAGERTEFFGTPKQLLQVGGEPILLRTIRQLKERGVVNPSVIAVERLLEPWGLPVYPPVKNPLPVASDGSQPYWSKDGLTIILLGDVIYSGAALDTIIAADPTRWSFFCRYGYNPDGTLGGGEGWAITFGPGQHARLNRLYRKLHRIGGKAARYHFWQLNRGWHAADIHEHTRFDDDIIIDDSTDDIDTPEAYAALVAISHEERR